MERQVIVNFSSSSVTLVLNEFDLPSSVQALIDKYPSVISSHITKEYCGIYHRTDKESHAPVFTKPRQLSGQKLERVQAEFKRLLNTGVIHSLSNE